VKRYIGRRIDCPYSECPWTFITWGGFFGHLRGTHCRVLTAAEDTYGNGAIEASARMRESLDEILNQYDVEMGQPHVGWRKRMHDAGHVAISAWDAFYVRVSPTSTGGSKR